MSRTTFLLCVGLIIPLKWMNFVAKLEPCFYGNSSILWIWCASIIRVSWQHSQERFLLKIITHLIDKICYYASCMDEPSLNDSEKLWFLTLFKCVLVSLLQNVVRSLLSAGGPNIESWSFNINILHCIFIYVQLMHAYQSFACETAINTDFSELFSLKHIYVKYKNAILSLIDCFFRTWKD